jgi:uncharacterized membrane protein YgdD (TMEM256/DUF423 family)
MENSEKNPTVSPPRNGLGWVSLGAGLAGLSIMLGAFGAHSLKALLTEKKLATFHTATDYLGYHAVGLIAIGTLMIVLNEDIHQKLQRSAQWLSTGIILFTGSLYVLTFDGPRFFGPITPLGGLCFMTGWITLAYSLFKHSRS